MQQAAPARFSYKTAWAPEDIAYWYFDGDAPDFHSSFQSGWAHHDLQDIIGWIFRPPEENETSRNQAAGTDIHTEEMAARMESQAGRPSQMAKTITKIPDQSSVIGSASLASSGKKGVQRSLAYARPKLREIANLTSHREG